MIPPVHDGGANEKLRAARAKAAFVRPYFTHAVMGLILVESKTCPTMAVDEWKRLYYNPNFIRECTVEELASVVLHELGHVLRDHSKRARAMGIGATTWKLANIAQDMSINHVLRDEIAARPHDGLAALPGDPYFPSHAGLPEGQLWEQYYVALLDNPEFNPAPHDCGSGSHGQLRPWEAGTPSTGTIDGVEEADWRDIQRIVASAIRSYRGRSSIAGGWQEWADTLLEPVHIPWNVLLSNRIRSVVASVLGDTSYTYEWPSRLQQAVPDAILPGMSSPQPRIAFVGDTSGSMNANDLALVRGVVSDICLRLNVTLTFLSVDAAVHGQQEVIHGGQVKLIGRGGTDMAVGIAHAAKLRPRPNYIVVATDCETPWPEAAPPIPVLICGVGACDVSDVPSWATFIKVEAKRSGPRHEDEDDPFNDDSDT